MVGSNSILFKITFASPKREVYPQTVARRIYGPTTRYPMLKIVKLKNLRASLTHVLDVLSSAEKFLKIFRGKRRIGSGIV